MVITCPSRALVTGYKLSSARTSAPTPLPSPSGNPDERGVKKKVEEAENLVL